MIESKCELLPIGEVEALLLEHEARIKKFQKRLADSPSIIVAQGYTSSINSYNSSSNNFNPQNQSNYSGNHGGFNRGDCYSYGGDDSDSGGGYSCGGNDFDRGGGHRGGGKGRGRYANFQCHVCFKFGPTVALCHFR